jgi:hypothetical protein
MRFNKGKYKGKSFEEVLLRDPAYVQWWITKVAPAVSQEFQKLIKVFDQKPMTVPCAECDNTATRASGYVGSAACTSGAKVVIRAVALPPMPIDLGSALCAHSTMQCRTSI